MQRLFLLSVQNVCIWASLLHTEKPARSPRLSLNHAGVFPQSAAPRPAGAGWHCSMRAGVLIGRVSGVLLRASSVPSELLSEGFTLQTVASKLPCSFNHVQRFDSWIFPLESQFSPASPQNSTLLKICWCWQLMCEVILGCCLVGTKTSPLNTISNQQLMTQFCSLLLFYFSPITFGWFDASWSQVGLIQPTASMTPWTRLDSHEEWANKSVMYDSHLCTRTCTQTHTEHMAIWRDISASFVHKGLCQQWCTVELKEKSLIWGCCFFCCGLNQPTIGPANLQERNTHLNCRLPTAKTELQPPVVCWWNVYWRSVDGRWS